jgi:hypothetical protein
MLQLHHTEQHVTFSKDNTTQHNTTQHNAMQRNTTQRNAMQPNTVHHLTDQQCLLVTEPVSSIFARLDKIFHHVKSAVCHISPCPPTSILGIQSSSYKVCSDVWTDVKIVLGCIPVFHHCWFPLDVQCVKDLHNTWQSCHVSAIDHGCWQVII